MILRPYQQQLITASRQAIAQGHHSIVCVSPTGSGKTVIFSWIASSAKEKGKRVLILVHRQEIFEQTLEKLHSFGVVAGQIRSGRITTRNNIHVAMVGTIVNRLQTLQDYDLIIVDEGHHATAKTWQKILSHFSGSIKLFFTATPERSDGRGLGDFCDCMVEGPTTASLVADGYLSFPWIKGPPKELLYNFHLTRGDFDKKEQVKIYTGKKIIGDVIEHHRQYLAGMPTISFVCSLQHGDIMQKVYRDAGIKAQLIQGGQKYSLERKEACKALADGSLEILISCDVISEGFDVPVVAGCHMLRRTMSTGLYIQQGGRALRPIYAPGMPLDTREQRLAAIKAGPKPVAYILDFVGNCDLHGHLIDRREWNLESIKRDPRKNSPEMTVCPSCGLRIPGKPKVCPDPDCGHRFIDQAARARKLKLEHISGQLIDAIPGIEQEEAYKMAAVMASEDKRKKQKFMFAMAFKAVQQDTRDNLDKLAEMAGYKKGWTDYAWNYAKDKVRV